MRPWRRIAALVTPAIGLVVLTGRGGHAQQAATVDRRAMFEAWFHFPSRLQGGAVTPHWMADGSSFWYADTTEGTVHYRRVDPRTGTVGPLFDEDRLRADVATRRGQAEQGPDLAIEDVAPAPGAGDRVVMTVGGTGYILDLDTRTLAPHAGHAAAPRDASAGWLVSPTGEMAARVDDHDLWIRSGADGDSVRLTRDGTPDHEWIVAADDWVRGFWTGTGASWSPDGRMLALKQIDGTQVEDLPFIRLLDPCSPVAWMRFPRAGDPTFQSALFVLDVGSGNLVRLDTGSEPDQRLEFLGWRGRDREVLFLRLDRRHTRLDLMAADPRTGASRVLLTEARDTYVVGAGHGFERNLLTVLPGTNRFIWRSGRDGWDHFYLYDFDGRMLHRLTRGRFPVLEAKGLNGDWFLFTARSEERPYDRYLYRVRLDGTGQERLSQAPGSHAIALSPSGDYLLDTHSSLERPPSVDLRRADGSLVRTLSAASLEALEGLGWRPPDEFVVKALDGTTDLHGVLYLPHDFDPARRYPVVEYIYNGEQMSLRAFERPFTSQRHLRAIAQMGFIVFLADGPGTPGRGVAFRQAGYMRLGQFEVPEHVNILRQLAADRPWMDLDRVGILGHSYGGYLALRAMLTAPEVYQVGIAMSPDVDFLHDHHFYFEPRMGFPADNPEGYAGGSNLPLAANLRGDLLLIVGTEDYGAYPGTMQMVGELVRHGRRHDLVVLPGQPHEFEGASEDYSFAMVVQYLVEHLGP